MGVSCIALDIVRLEIMAYVSFSRAIEFQSFSWNLESSFLKCVYGHHSTALPFSP
jgi:hypothetical protein